MPYPLVYTTVVFHVMKQSCGPAVYKKSYLFFVTVVLKSILNPTDQRMKLLFLALIMLEWVVPNSALETARPSYRRVRLKDSRRSISRRMKRIAARRVHRMAMILKRKSLI